MILFWTVVPYATDPPMMQYTSKTVQLTLPTATDLRTKSIEVVVFLQLYEEDNQADDASTGERKPP